jgi:hypothetical protein
MAGRKSQVPANWEQEMALQAKAAVEQESTAGSGGGRFFSLRAGQLTFNDSTFPGNQLAVVILDSIFENTYYEGSFDAENVNSPTCYAMGRDAETMGPPKEVDEYDEFDRQNDVCKTCWANEWGSAEKGKGKACANRRRLAIIPAGTFSPLKGGGFELELDQDPKDFASAEVAYIKLPVMSVKGFAAYLKQVAEQFGRPLHGVFTRIYVEPDPKSQFRIKFELIEPIEGDLMPTIMTRHSAIKDEIAFPYIPRSDDEAAPQTQRSASSGAKLRKSAAPVKKVGGAKKRR